MRKMLQSAGRSCPQRRFNILPSFEVGAKPLFGELAAHYIQRELPEDQTEATIEKAYSTTRKYKRYLSRWALPRWGTTPALAVHPPDVEDWLRELKKKFELRNPTLGEIRKAMNNVYVQDSARDFYPAPRMEIPSASCASRSRATSNRSFSHCPRCLTSSTTWI
jgi:hypothetical protein